MELNRRFERCYREARRHLGEGAEPFSVVETAEAHRRFWQPPETRVLLLAESHVYTPAEERVRMVGPIRYGPAGAPEHFVRLVYCIGYGESSYVGRELRKNTGTWQYWKIFSSCLFNPADDAFNSVLKRHKPVNAERIAAKIALLNALKNMGVWLVDSSILALYTPRQPKPNKAVRFRVLQTCWDEYIGYIVAGVRPRRIIVVGKEVEEALRGRIARVSGGNHRVINQPQGLRSVERIAQAYEHYHEECAEHGIEPPNQAL